MSTAPLDPVVAHVVLRDRDRWTRAEMAGLQMATGGHLELARVPAVEPPWDVPQGRAGTSGLAADHHCGLYLADTLGGRLLRFGLDCGERLVLSGLQEPAGLSTGPFGWLFLAESGRGRVLVYTTPDLALRDVWPGLTRPTAVAAGDEWVVVLDDGRVRRFDPAGRPDLAYDATLAGPDGPQQPTAIALGPNDSLYVGETAGGIRRFDAHGVPSGERFVPDALPGALAMHGDVLYLADTGTGRIGLVHLPSGEHLGEVAGFRGTVTALAVDPHGRLFIKTGLDDHYLASVPGGGRIPRGSLVAGPFDAGEENSWLRQVVEATVPAETAVTLDAFGADDATASPAGKWRRSPVLDALAPSARFLWLRVELRRDPDAGVAVTPVVHQVRAETGGDSYLDHLPAVYSRDPVAGDPLRRFLELVRSELGDLEATVGGLTRRYDVVTAPGEWLAILAMWLGFEVPAPLTHPLRAHDLRSVLAELPELYRRRATPAGLRRYAEIWTGASLTLVEAFASRGIWELDSSVLDFDTRLPSTAVDGLIVGEATVGGSGPLDPERWGAALFDPTAHAFTVLVPEAAVPDQTTRDRLARVLDAEKPAHTDVHVCVVRPRLRVGFQATVGVDAMVGGDEPAWWLDRSGALDHDARLGEAVGGGTATGVGRVGVDTVVG